MAKRYIRIDLEYDTNDMLSTFSYQIITNNIKRVLREDMPYVKVLFTRDAPKESDLNEDRMLTDSR